MRAALSLLRRRNDRRGSNAVEFALTAPVLFFLLLSTMDMGWFFAHALVMDHVTSTASRVAAMKMDFEDGSSSLDPGYSSTSAIGQAEWAKFGLPGTPTFTYAPSLESGVYLIQVTGSVAYNDFGGWNSLLGGNLQVFPDNIQVVIKRRAEQEIQAVDAN